VSRSPQRNRTEQGVPLQKSYFGGSKFTNFCTKELVFVLLPTRSIFSRFSVIGFRIAHFLFSRILGPHNPGRISVIVDQSVRNFRTWWPDHLRRSSLFRGFEKLHHVEAAAVQSGLGGKNGSKFCCFWPLVKFRVTSVGIECMSGITLPGLARATQQWPQTRPLYLATTSRP